MSLSFSRLKRARLLRLSRSKRSLSDWRMACVRDSSVSLATSRANRSVSLSFILRAIPADSTILYLMPPVYNCGLPSEIAFRDRLSPVTIFGSPQPRAMPEPVTPDFAHRPNSANLRYDWTRDSVRGIYHRPLLDLIFAAQQVHRMHHDPARIQLCRLLSIKTGGCPEDCGYCPQSAHYETGVQNQPLMDVDEVYRAARKARDEGASRFCMGAAWREVRDGRDFDAVLAMVRAVASLNLEVCCTLGMVTDDQPRRLAAAGLTAYNHNLDAAPAFYGHSISRRNYEDLLRTIQAIR